MLLSIGASVKAFKGQWPLLVDLASASMKKLFDMRAQVLGDMKANREGCVVCAVSDPRAQDCPLVFVSRGFEEMTGYCSDDGLAKNCRFLQPTPAKLNQRINGEEVTRLRRFCTQEIGEGMERCIISVLLNERKTGERFWNLLHMQYVHVNNNPYILAVQTILNLPMPLAIRSAEDSESCAASDPAAFAFFIEELRKFLTQLRREVQVNPDGNIKVAQHSATARILAFMKKASPDYDGDHFVPLVGQDRVAIFQRDIRWSGILRVVSDSLFKFWEGSDKDAETMACTVSDPAGEDCPLVYVSHGFEKLTGYSHEWVLGRNCRFLQPKQGWMNDNLNKSERKRMHAFCKDSSAKCSRIVTLLVNERKNGYPFWNLLVMEHISVSIEAKSAGSRCLPVKEQRPYIVAVLTPLDSNLSKLVEVLAMDPAGIGQLARLRKTLHAAERSLGTQPLKSWFEAVLQGWERRLPPFMLQPELMLPSVGSAKAQLLPKFGLEITHETAIEEVPRALVDGVRHFYLAYSMHDRVGQDSKYAALQNRLLVLKLSELFYQLKSLFLHYLRDGITFTLLSPPIFIEGFHGVWKCMADNGYNLACWMLDLRGMDPRNREKKVRESWQSMVAVQRCGRIRALGVCGGSKELLLEVQRSVGGGVIAACALEAYPGRPDWDGSYARWISQLRNQGIALIAMNVSGPRHCVLNSPGLSDASLRLQVEPVVLLARWAEVQGFGVMLPKLRAGALALESWAPERAAQSLPRPSVEAAGSSGEGPALTEQRAFLRDLHKVPMEAELLEHDAPQAPFLESLTQDAPSPRRPSMSNVGEAQLLPAGPSAPQMDRTKIQKKTSGMIRAQASPGAAGLGPMQSDYLRSNKGADGTTWEAGDGSTTDMNSVRDINLKKGATLPQLPLDTINKNGKHSNASLAVVETLFTSFDCHLACPGPKSKALSQNIHPGTPTEVPKHEALRPAALGSRSSAMPAFVREATSMSPMELEPRTGHSEGAATDKTAATPPKLPASARRFQRPFPTALLTEALRRQDFHSSPTPAPEPPPEERTALASATVVDSVAAWPVTACAGKAQAGGRGIPGHMAVAVPSKPGIASDGRASNLQLDTVPAPDHLSARRGLAVRLAAKGMALQDIASSLQLERRSVESILGEVC